jgi:hypothetical protein
VIRFQQQFVQPDFPGYISAGDFLQVTIFTTALTSGLTLAGRILGPTGEVQVFEYNLDGAPVSTFTTRIEPVSEGFLISLSVSALNSGLADQSCFVAVGLQTGPNAGLPPHTLLAHGYVSNLNTIEWPPVVSRVVASSGGQTFTAQSISIPAPAVSSEIRFTVPAGTTYTLKAFRFIFTTGGGAGTRQPGTYIDDGANQLFVGDGAFFQQQLTTVHYAAGSGTIARSGGVNIIMCDLPYDLPVTAGYTVGTLTGNLQAGDQFSASNLLVLKWN